MDLTGFGAGAVHLIPAAGDGIHTADGRMLTGAGAAAGANATGLVTTDLATAGLGRFRKAFVCAARAGAAPTASTTIAIVIPLTRKSNPHKNYVLYERYRRKPREP